MAKQIKSLELHYQMIQFLIISDVASESNIFFEFQTAVYSKNKNFGFIKGIDNGWISTVKGLESCRFRALNEGLTLETSAF